VYSDLVTHGLHEIDLWLGDIVKATKDAGIFKDTDFFIVSDHGHLNVCRSIAPNAVFAERGLIDVGPDGAIRDYKAFCKSTGLSAQIYLKDPSDNSACSATYALLSEMKDSGLYGISRVYTAKEAEREEHLAGRFSFVVESDGFTTFSNEWLAPIVRNREIKEGSRTGYAAHGHHPDRGPQPTVIAFGPHIRAGATVEKARLVDEAPTFAKALGVELGKVDGAAVEGILKE
jgi:predicted AlkP superfamily pyrophosphatase or phosphodiesterase